MDSYWDLYVAYVHHCVEYNKKFDIDPHHYEMEWNHFLPQCLFGDWPIGQWLTLRQHAIASALQTLAFQHSCLCGFHKKYLPDELVSLAWPYYVKSKQKWLSFLRSKVDASGRSIPTVKALEVIHSDKNEEGKSKHAVKAANESHRVKTTEGKSQRAVEHAIKINAQRWKCLTTGFISNPGNLTKFQKARGLSTDSDNRVRVQ
jgi:hypothetical protein